jgi:hypothetical protein
MTTPPATSNLAPTRPPGTAPGRAVTATLAALLGGMALGALDDALATWWAWAAHSLANSAGAWVLACFLVAWFAKTTRGAATRGLACLVGLVAGFYLVAPLHTPPPSNGLLPFWLVVAAIVGPLIGLAAGTARRGRPRWATVAAVTVGSVIAVDALLQGTSPLLSTGGRSGATVYWYIQAAIGVGLPIALLLVRRYQGELNRSLQHRAVGVSVGDRRRPRRESSNRGFCGDDC